MTTSRLRDTFALLLREGHDQPAALSADAERAIRRRIGLRWGGRIGALAAVGALVTAAMVAASGGAGGTGLASPSPTPTPTLGRAAVAFPVAGGPEFASAAAGLKCGDPAPKPHPTEHDLALRLTQTREWNLGDTITSYNNLPGVAPRLEQRPDTDLGIVGNSGISLIVSSNGVIVGVSQVTGVDVGWNSPTSEYQFPRGGQYDSQLLANWIACPGVDTPDRVAIVGGAYVVVAMARVFSTPESVALYQELGYYGSGSNLDPAGLDPQGVYLPGSYDCAQTVAQQAPARGCLSDFTPNAKYNPHDATVTVLYDTNDFVEEFSTVLVSEPLTVNIPGKDDVTFMGEFLGVSQGVFDSIDDFTCGASEGSAWFASRNDLAISTWLPDEIKGPWSTGGSFTTYVWGIGVEDGSTVELMPGARIIYLDASTIQEPDANSAYVVETVIGSSDVSAAGPITTNRFSGPQLLDLTGGPPATCPGVDAPHLTRSDLPLLVGTWRITAPGGAITTLDTGSALSHMNDGG